MHTEFVKKINNTFSKQEAEVILNALSHAMQAHKDQKRHSGEPYIIHPIAVAEILMEYGMDYYTIAASLLHDEIEDTNITEQQLKDVFGEEIASLVNGVSKIKTLKYKSYDESNAENLRKMFFAMSKDIRVVLIKLADRLHNMRTLNYLPQDRQLKKAKDTFDVYVPIAERLGLSKIKTEMEDLCFKYLKPEAYKSIQNNLVYSYEKHRERLDTTNLQLKDMLKSLDIHGEVFSRFKNSYSIYVKLSEKGIDKIYDILAHRILVDNIKECYTVLGEAHNIWKPIPGRIKDYIAAPKPNMYQSLHTTLLTEEGIPFELQIRTYEMHKTCEYGIAAHWKYKEGITDKSFSQIDKRLAFIRESMELNKEISDPKAFINYTLTDFYSKTIFVFTPKFKVIQLPENSTSIDFAYSIHTDLGNKCVGVKINGKLSQVSTPLKTGDIVEIITSNSKSPSRDWIKFAKTSTARNRIKNYFKKEMREENIKLGYEMLDLEAKKKGFNFSTLLLDQKSLKALQEKFNFIELDDLYASVGYGAYTSNQIVSKLLHNINMLKKKERVISEKPQDSPHSHSAVVVDGTDGLYIRLGKCCNPIPGDEIIGFTTRGKGIIVHRTNCPNMKNIETERLINVSWADIANVKFNMTLHIRAKDSTGTLSKISSVLSNMDIYISALKASVVNNESKLIMTVQISSKNQINDIINKLSQIDDIIDIYRK